MPVTTPGIKDALSAVWSSHGEIDTVREAVSTLGFPTEERVSQDDLPVIDIGAAKKGFPSRCAAISEFITDEALQRSLLAASGRLKIDRMAIDVVRALMRRRVTETSQQPRQSSLFRLVIVEGEVLQCECLMGDVFGGLKKGADLGSMKPQIYSLQKCVERATSELLLTVRTICLEEPLFAPVSAQLSRSVEALITSSDQLVREWVSPERSYGGTESLCQSLGIN